MKSVPRPFAPILLASIALCAGLATRADAAPKVIELAPRAAELPGAEASWNLDALGASAGSHPLMPRVATGGLTVFQATIPGAGLVRMVPLGIRSAVSGGKAALPLGTPLIEAGPRAQVLFVRETWLGVDEVFELRAGEIEHDLLVGADAMARLGRGGVSASWSLELPPGVVVRQGATPRGDLSLEDGAGRRVARIPAPRIADGSSSHWTHGVARWELTGTPEQPELTLLVPGSWTDDPARVMPLRLDPTLAIPALNILRTGFVDELDNRLDGEMVSGSLLDVGYGAQARAFAMFDTDAVPDAAVIQSVRLHVWLDNHDNPTDPAVPLRMEIKAVPITTAAPTPVLWAAIPPLGAGVTYAFEVVPRTGPVFCPSSYAFRDYDLGPMAATDLQARLLANTFTIGFVSEIVTDPFFDHIDYIGYPETVENFACPVMDFPGTRITLLVTYEDNTPPTCDAGGPYASDCPSTPIVIDGSRSSDADGDPLTFAWTTGCPGSLDDPSQAITTLRLEPGCSVACTVTLVVDDGQASSTCSQPVVAIDTTPPVVVANRLDGACVWSPNHDMACLGDPSLLVQAVDACQSRVVLKYVGCASDQPDEAREPGRPENGDGSFPNDCQISADGLQVCIRAERAGHDPVSGRNTFDGRHYAVAVAADDGCGNVVVVGGTVNVPHDRRGGSGGQDDPCLRATGGK